MSQQHTAPLRTKRASRDIKVLNSSEMTSEGRAEGGGERLYKKFMRLWRFTLLTSA